MNAQLQLRAPQLVVYSDGTAVLGASKKFTLKQADLNALLATLRTDLAGQPAILRPPHPIPDIGDTILGVRQADGTYQRLAANGLAHFGATGGYPAVVYDAYTKLLAVAQSPDANNAGPFTSNRVRLAYLCSSTSATPVKPWPAGLPQPTVSGPGCSESLVAGGAAVGAAMSACQLTTTGGVPSAAYQSDKGVRTCQWRPALPDES